MNGGDISIEGLGLNASNISQFDLITRAVQINADLHAQKLNMVLGRNQVDYPSLVPTTLSPSDGKPDFALDSSVLGGMYSNSIHLIGTEAGVGVRTLGNVASSAGDLSLSADGKLTLNKLQSAGKVTLTSLSDDIDLNQRLRSEDSIILRAQNTINNNYFTTALNHITLNAENVVQQGTLASGVSVAQNSAEETTYLINRLGKLNIIANNDINNRGHLASGGELDIHAHTTLNQASGEINSKQTLAVEGRKLTNHGAINSAASIQTTLTDALLNNATIEAADTLNLNAASLNNRGGTLTSVGNGNSRLITSGTLDNTDGTIGSNAQNLTVTASTVINDDGRLTHTGDGTLMLSATANTGTGLSNRRGNIASNNSVTITTGPENSRSDIDTTSGSITGTAISLKANNITNNGGLIEGNNVDIQTQGNLENQRDNEDVSSQDNTGLISALGIEIDALKLTITGEINNRDSTIQSNAETATIQSAYLINERGHIRHTGSGQLTLNNTDYAINNTAGKLISNGSLTAYSVSLDNTDGTVKTSNGAINLAISNALTNTSGTIEANDSLTLNAGSLSNRNGTITSIGTDDSQLTTSGSLDNSEGLIQSNAQNLSLNARTVTNNNGKIMHRGSGDLSLSATEINNRGGIIASAGRLIATDFISLYNTLLTGQVAEIQADHIELDSVRANIDNNGGKLIATGSNSININANQLDNDNGIVDSQGDLDLTLLILKNNAGLIQSNDSLTLTLPTFNFDSGIFNAANDLIINTRGNITNGVGNQLITNGKLELNAATGSIDNQGEISSLFAVTLSGSTLNNAADAIISSGNDLTLDFSGDITNTGRLSAAQDLFLSAANLSNHGIIAAGNTLQATLTGNLDNYNTLFAGNDANFYVANRLHNREGSNIFAINNITISANDSLAKNQEIINESATIEAFAGNINLYANTVNNKKARITVDDGRLISGTITYYCHDCRHDHYYVDYIIAEKFKSEITEDSPTAKLIAGGNLLINADTLNNEHSLISADGDLSFNLGELNNLSSGNFDLTRTTTYFSGEITDGTHHRSLVNEIASYNELNSPKTYRSVDVNSCASKTTTICLPRYELVLGHNPNYDVDATHSSYNPFPSSYVVSGVVEDITNTGQASSSTIQASGNAVVTIAGVLNNGDVQQNAALPTHTERDEETHANGRDLQDVAYTTTGTITSTADETDRLTENQKRLTLASYNPIEGLTLPQTDGLFVVNNEPSHSFLVETNPEFAQYTQFISSDYFFDKIGLNPEQSAKRLGDGFYETRLVRDAVFATTGRRYLAGQTSDQAQFEYLMDNAVAARNELELTVGIALNAEQVARLTHDIIWMVEQQVQGQTVLAPVYYATGIKAGDLHSSGSLLTATTLSLSANEVNNEGTIEAKQELTLRSANNLLNHGSLRSGTDLSVTAQKNIRNIGGEISSSGDLLLVARTGDIELTREVKKVNFQRGGQHQITQIATQSKIQSGGDVTLQAGQDISLIGSSLKATKDITVKAEGDIKIEAVQDQSTSVITGRKRYRTETETIRQLASGIEAGGSVSLDSDQAITLSASTIKADDNIALTAIDDITIASRANKQHSDTQRKRNRNINTQTQQQQSTLTASGDITVDSQKNLTLTASKLDAGNDITLAVQGDTTIESAQNTDYSYAYKKRKKSFGRSKTKTRESEQLRNVASSLNADGDILINTQKTNLNTLVLNRKADSVTFVGSDINAGKDIAIYAQNDINASPGTDYDYSYSKTSKKGLLGTGSSKTITSKQQRQQGAQIKSGKAISLDAGNNIALISPTLTATDNIELNADNKILLGTSKDSDYLHEQYDKTGAFKWEFGNQGHNDETVRHTEITAGGDIKIDAGNGVIVEYKQDGSLSESIASLSQLPELAWMGELKNRDDIDWQAIEEAHEQWQEHEEGVGGPGVTLVMIAIAIATGGAGAGLLGVSGELTVIQAAQAAIIDSLINQAASSLIANGGDIGAVFKDVLSKDGILSLATAGATAGITNSLFESLDIPNKAIDLNNPTIDTVKGLNLGQQLQRNIISAAVHSGVSTTLQGGDFKKNLFAAAASATVNTIAADLTNEIGDWTLRSGGDITEGGLIKILSHASVGCAAQSLTGGSCSAGALGAATAELLAPHLSAAKLSSVQAELTVLLGTGLAALVTGEDLEQAITAGLNVERNNRQEHISRDLDVKISRENNINIPDHRANVVIRDKITDYPDDIRQQFGDPILVEGKGYVYVLEDLSVSVKNKDGRSSNHLYPSVNDSRPNGVLSPSLNDYINNTGHLQTYQTLPDDFESENNLMRGYISDIDRGIANSPRYPTTWETLKCAMGNCSDNFYNSNTGADNRLENANIPVPDTGSASVPGGFYDREGASNDRESANDNNERSSYSERWQRGNRN